ncbi:late expression factor 9 [Neodiprion abietis nucleopolyhedrovirus]|uniref:Late expression factor 9 n=1 Tax=Neodiprion abietis nucleopolyhedrovirus TaxID=204507 RepID=Q0ZP41_9CBAC|nr:late expression factor 9 [Neodiprion abietis nucleopolyhedrovirus]ABC74913.1 late expression factor 9 [Neodiprion abietis nucleopolyhedrovirus]
MDKFDTATCHRISSIVSVEDCDKNSIKITVKVFKKFLLKVLFMIKSSVNNSFNVSLLLIVQQQLCDTNRRDVKFLKLLRDVITASNVIITEMQDYTIFVRKLKTSNTTDNCDFLILPAFVCWDKTFAKTLYKYLYDTTNAKTIAIGTELQKIRLPHGTILEQIQNKDSFSGQHVYGHQLNKRSQIANVLCYNAANSIILPEYTVERYYGVQINPNITLRCKSTRHPNISQLSTHTARIDRQRKAQKNNVCVGLGTFIGANRDCDGDKEITTMTPYPNNVLCLEQSLYDDPEYSMIQFDKIRLSFCPQQIYYLYVKREDIDTMLVKYPLIYKFWTFDKNQKFSTRLHKLIYHTTLSLGSRVAFYLYKTLIDTIDDMSVFCNIDEVENLNGVFETIVESGAKGSVQLLKNIREKKNRTTDVEQIHKLSQKCLNHSVESLNSVRKAGQNIYKSATMLDGIFVENNVLFEHHKRNEIIPLEMLSNDCLVDNVTTTVITDYPLHDMYTKPVSDLTIGIYCQTGCPAQIVANSNV